MGLDMNLYGEYAGEIEELGYWRKHPNLHGFIVQTFANGEDDCERIYLSAKDLKTIYDAINIEALPHTEGFFFGTSRPEDRFASLAIFENAIKWLDNSDKKIYYQASW